MKKLLGFLLVICFSLFSLSSVHAAQKAHLVINDTVYSGVETDIEIRDGTTYAPIRTIADGLGATLDWDSTSGSISLRRQDQSASFYTVQKVVYAANDTTPQAFKLYIKNGVTMVSVQQAGSIFGYIASYVSTGPMVRLKTNAAVLSDEEILPTLPPFPKPPVRVEPKATPIPIPGNNVAYLTFDDGPNQYTPQILQLLSKYNAKATFFFLQNYMESNPKIVQRVIDEGHTIGLHGVTHDFGKVYASAQSVVNEMNACNDTLEAITGIRSRLVRVPYGSKPHMPKAYRDKLFEYPYRLWDWNVDSYDSRANYVAPKTIIANVKQQVSGKSSPVILLHDRKHTVEALEEILKYLQANGYAMKAITPELAPVNFWNDIR